MARRTRDHELPASHRARRNRGSSPNLWKRVIYTQPAVSSGASMWILYVLGALLIVISVFTLFAAILLAVGEIGTGWQGRVAGGVGILVALASFLVGRWMTGAMEPRT